MEAVGAPLSGRGWGKRAWGRGRAQDAARRRKCTRVLTFLASSCHSRARRLARPDITATGAGRRTGLPQRPVRPPRQRPASALRPPLLPRPRLPGQKQGRGRRGRRGRGRGRGRVRRDRRARSGRSGRARPPRAAPRAEQRLAPPRHPGRWGTAMSGAALGSCAQSRPGFSEVRPGQSGRPTPRARPPARPPQRGRRARASPGRP
jgi:hypothetical protein